MIKLPGSVLTGPSHSPLAQLRQFVNSLPGTPYTEATKSLIDNAAANWRYHVKAQGRHISEEEILAGDEFIRIAYDMLNAAASSARAHSSCPCCGFRRY